MGLFKKRKKMQSLSKTVQVNGALLSVHICMMEGERSGDSIDIDGNGELIIGSHGSCDLVLDGAGVCLRHCRIFIMNDKYFIENIDPAAITRIGGMRIHQMNPLRTGDIISIGDNSFEVTSL